MRDKKYYERPRETRECEVQRETKGDRERQREIKRDREEPLSSWKGHIGEMLPLGTAHERVAQPTGPTIPVFTIRVPSKIRVVLAGEEYSGRPRNTWLEAVFNSVTSSKPNTGSQEG